MNENDMKENIKSTLLLQNGNFKGTEVNFVE